MDPNRGHEAEIDLVEEYIAALHSQTHTFMVAYAAVT